jgi:predicted dehydrogenase
MRFGSMVPSPMKIGVFGLGFMGSTHLKALKKIPHAHLAAVLSDVPQQLTGDLSSIQGNLGGPGEVFDFSQVAKYRHVPDALRDPDVEAVDLCLPTNLHADVAILALQAGKHVLVEKPMALSGEQCDRMIETARSTGKTLMVAQVLRFFPEYRTLIDIARARQLGVLRSAIFRRRCAAPFWSQWLKNRHISGGGVFDLLIHDVDIAVRAFGVPEAISAVGHEDLENGIDFVEARFHYPDCDSVIITGGWHHFKSYPFSMEYTVSFDGGTLDYSSAGRPLKLYNSGGEEKLMELPEVDGYQAELEYFIECARERKHPELCPPEESAAAVKLARIMDEARSRKGEKVPCRI